MKIKSKDFRVQEGDEVSLRKWPTEVEPLAAFDGGTVSSDAVAPLLEATDRAIWLVDRFAGCFRDPSRPPGPTDRARLRQWRRLCRAGDLENACN